MKPTLKKTVTGYVIKHKCICGELLTNKISEVDAQDYCPSCNVGFVVPGRDLVLQLKAKMDREKEQRHQDKEATRARKRARAESKRSSLPEPPVQSPIIAKTPIRRSSRPTNDSQLRLLADTAGRWVCRSNRLMLTLAIIVQLVLVVWVVFVLFRAFDAFSMWTLAGSFVLFTILNWLTYQMIRSAGDGRSSNLDRTKHERRMTNKALPFV